MYNVPSHPIGQIAKRGGGLVVLPGEAIHKFIYVLTGKLQVNFLFSDGRERMVYFVANIVCSTIYFNITPTIRIVNHIEVNINLPLRDISEIIGAHYVTVSKVFCTLNKLHILDKKRDRIVIFDIRKLEELTQETQLFKTRKAKYYWR